MNHRFYRDVFHMKRPGLSVNGFDNSGDNSHGYGLKQIIELLYSGDATEQKTFQDIVTSSGHAIKGPNYGGSDSQYSIGQVQNNSTILENKALVALVLYILHKNSVSSPIPGTGLSPDNYETYIDDLHNDLLEPAVWYAVYGNGDGKGDDDNPVKWTRSVDNYARAIDLYLALENAFGYYGESDYTETGSSRLLSKAQKYNLLNDFYLKVKDMHNYEYKLETWEGIVLPVGVRNYEAEDGNRPMKIFVSMGYGALTLQATDYYSGFQTPSDNTLYNNSTVYKDAVTGDPSSEVTSSYLNEAFRSAGLQTTDNSIYYWNYQTDNGEQFWAEGPYYFEYSLLDIIPFWYAVRANNLLNYESLNVSDHFTHQWFLGPLNWMASLVTPHGKVPPLDDGNKQFIRYSDMLRWQPVFGSSSLGQKYEWIYNTVQQYNGNSDKSAEIVAPRHAAAIRGRNRPAGVRGRSLYVFRTVSAITTSACAKNHQ